MDLVEEHDGSSSNSDRDQASNFHRMLYQLMVQNEDQFKDFVHTMSPNYEPVNYDAFRAVVAFTAMLEQTAITKDSDESWQDSDDFDTEDAMGSSSEEEADDAVAPLDSMSVNWPQKSTESLDEASEGEGRFLGGGAAVARSLRGRDAASHASSRRDRLAKSIKAGGSSRRVANLNRRSTIRQSCMLRRSVFQQEIHSGSHDEDDQTHATRTEADYIKFLESEIEHLEQLLDDQEDEIDELDKTVSKYKRKNEGMNQEIKTKKRTILILEEKYALLKLELDRAVAKGDSLQLKMHESEADLELNYLTATNERDELGGEVNSLRKQNREQQETLKQIQESLGKKDERLLLLMGEMEELKKELLSVKMGRSVTEASPTAQAAASRGIVDFAESEAARHQRKKEKKEKKERKKEKKRQEESDRQNSN